MKQTYQKPVTEIDEMDMMSCVMAGSTPTAGINQSADPIDAGSVESRSTDWFDDEEE